MTIMSYYRKLNLSCSVSSNCTDKLQPLDSSVNKQQKTTGSRNSTNGTTKCDKMLHHWKYYAKKVTEQTDAGKGPDEVVMDI